MTKKVIDDATAEAKSHIESSDKDELEKAAKDLLDKLQPIGSKMYEQTSGADEAKSSDQSTEAGSEGGSTAKEGETKEGPVEGEVVEDK